MFVSLMAKVKHTNRGSFSSFFFKMPENLFQNNFFDLKLSIAAVIWQNLITTKLMFLRILTSLTFDTIFNKGTTKPTFFSTLP